MSVVEYALFPPAPDNWGWEHEWVERTRADLPAIFDGSKPIRTAVQDRAIAEVRDLLSLCEDDTELAFLTGALSALEAIHDIMDAVLHVSAVCDASKLHDLVLLKQEQTMVVMLRLLDLPDQDLPPLVTTDE